MADVRMKKRNKILVGILLFLVLAVAGGTVCVITFVDWSLTAVFEGVSGREVDATAWSQLQIGMTKDQVHGIMGEPDDKWEVLSPSARHRGNWWQYGWISARPTDEYMVGLPAGKAYVVFFDDNNNVEKLKPPRKVHAKN